MTRMMKRALIVLVPVAAAAVGLTITTAGGNTRLTAAMKDASGADAGTVSFDIKKGAADVDARVSLPTTAAGFHGFHIHSAGVCDPTSVDPASGSVVPFFSAGGHLGGGAGGQTHAGHDGDMPSLLVRNNGKGTLTFRTDRATMAKLLDADGSAVVIHAGPDNFANIPSRYSATGADTTTLNTGDSGGRSLCGVLQ